MSDARIGKRRPFAQAIAEHGAEAFSHEILEIVYTLEDANEAESWWIARLDCVWPRGFNLDTGGNATNCHGPSNAKRWETRRARYGPAGRPPDAWGGAAAQVKKSAALKGRPWSSLRREAEGQRAARKGAATAEFARAILHALSSGLTHQELADALGVARPTVSRWAAAKVVPAPDVQASVLRRLGQAG